MTHIPAPTRILLIEDNPDDVRIVEQLLAQSEAEFDLTAVGRLADAQPYLTAEQTDLILLDLGLPDAEPAETFDRVRATVSGLPVIILTGRDDGDMAIRAVGRGAQDFLVKRAIDTPLLVRSLRYAIERQRYQTVRESEERYALAVEGAIDGLWDWNLATNEVYYSPRWQTMLGLTPAVVAGSPDHWFARVHDADLARLRDDIDRHLAGETDHFSNEHRMCHVDGDYRWVLSRGVAKRDAQGATRMAGSLTDINDRKASEDRLKSLALRDALTALPNWASFNDRLRASIAHARRRPDRQFAVLFLDLDRFKTINDSLGHTNGDTLLVATAERVAEVLRPGDTLARLGGDEFAALIESCNNPRDAQRVAERIHEQFTAPFRLDGHEVFITASIGIAMSAPRYKQPEECLRDANTAMYRAKSAGRGGHAIFDRDMHARAVQQLQLENDLRRAVDRREFHVYYQPIVSLDTGIVEGFEALVRWDHPSRGLLQPDGFIPMAEETGLIVPIGWLVLEEACRQLVVWNKPPNERIFVSVNMSGRQFREPDLVPRVAQLLESTGCDPQCLRLELTETMIMEDPEAGIQKLAGLSDLHLKVYIDDFGTGYSSLSYLQRLPTHAIKIDRSFVSEVAGNPEIVGTIVALARSLHMEVEAEGIETRAQLAQLLELGCQSGQGYYFSKALTSHAAGSLLSAQYAH